MDKTISRLLDLMEEGAIIIKGGVVEYVNKRVLTMLHLGKEDVVGNPPDTVFPQGIWRQLKPSVVKARSAQGRKVRAEVRFEDPTYGEVALRFHIVVQDGATLIQVGSIPRSKVGMVERKVAEMQERLAAMLGFIASSNIGVVLLERNADGAIHIRSVNEHFCAIIGRGEADVVGHDPHDFVHPDDRERTRRHLQQLWELGVTDQPLKIDLVDANDETVQTHLSMTLLSELDGDVAICFVQDVTAFDMALEEQRRFALAIEHVEETVVLSDGTGRIFYANPAALRNSGYRLDEVIGKPVSIFHAPETVGPVAGQALQEFMRRGYWRGDLMACNKDGVRYPVEVIGSLVRDEEGRPSMIIIVSRRIGERLRYEAELMLTQRHMEFISDVLSRDLVPELEGALADIEGMQAGLSTSEGAEGPLGSLESLLGHIRSMIGSMTMASTDSEKARALHPMDLSTVLQERSAELHGYLSKRGVELSQEILDEDIVVMANDMLLESLNGFGRLADRLSPDAPIRVHLLLRKMPQAPGDPTPSTFAELSASVLGIAIPEAIRDIRVDPTMTLSLRPVDNDFTYTVETANLLAYLSGGQFYTEDIDPAEPGKGFKFVIVLPLIGTRKMPAGTLATLEDLNHARREVAPPRPRSP